MKIARFEARTGGRFRLKGCDPSDTDGVGGKEEAEQQLSEAIGTMRDLQEKLYAQDRWALLIVLQAMDAAGKDSTIAHVMSGLNPQGCEVYSFKSPSDEELDHDFLWRTCVRLPRRGHIGIFNRSYYEEVLVARMHPEILARQKLPPRFLTKQIWEERFEDINSHERYLARNGIVVRKIFLHISKEEQRKRFLARLDDPRKRWKFAIGDVRERQRWDEYMEAYERALEATSTEHAPWYVVPGNQKWVGRAIVADILVRTLRDLKLRFPKMSLAHSRELAEARRLLQKEKE